MARRLSELRRDVEALRRQFLPNPFDPLGVYPNLTYMQTQTRAFLVLSHAELETYFEDWARDLTRASERLWRNSRRVAPPLAFLLAWSAERLRIPQKLTGRSIGDPHLEQLTTKLFQAFYTRVNENNGVKEANVLSLFGPLGIDHAAFTAALLPNLDELGAIRGTHAHGARKAVASVLDPETEYQRIQTILKDLELLEAWLVAYRRRIR